MIAATQPRAVDRDIPLILPDRPLIRTDRKPVEIEYPESDGKPMGETEFHVIATLHLYGALLVFFSSRNDVYVAADMFLYYEEGNRYANKSPDVMVIKGVPKRKRRTFKIWEEQASPCVIFEVTSKTTSTADIAKCSLYARLGVREYFLFDPLGEYLERELIGYQLTQGEYVEIVPDETGRLFSEELGLFLYQDDALLRIIEPQTDQPVPSFLEAAAQARQERMRAEQEAERAEQESQRAEREAQRAEQEAQHAEQESQRAEQEARRAEQEAQRAEQEAQRAAQEAQRAEQEAQHAEQESQRAEQEARRAERLAAQLRALGIEPD